jgi:hypothetical protein
MHNNLPKSVTISPNGNKYEVKFPNTGEYLDIMSIKSRLTSDLSLNDVYSSYAYLMAEMIATYTVMIPALKKDLNVESISQLSLIESKELLDSYTDVYKPFFDGWMAVITKPKSKPEDDK